jgi:hypothetical protein
MALTKATYSMVQGAPLNVLDFGSVGNGTTDDTAAIQAAFDVGGAIVFPSGYTFVSSKLSITQDIEIFGYDSILLHKTNSAATGVGLLEMKVDKKLIIRGLRIDGNGSNQTATYASYNMIWCSIGAMELYGCWIGNSKGHAIRTGNIDDFNAAYFAHDITINDCKVYQSATANQSGDCIRIERTRGDNLFVNNYVFGGLSGMRTQLYCKNLRFYNNEVCNSWADVGITVAMSENLEIIGNYCHHHFAHGYEIDGVVNCTNNGNTAYRNGKSGFIVAQFGASAYANNPIFWGSIAEGYGTDYSDQTYTSPKVPNINTVHIDNVSIENGEADRLIGLDSDVYAYNYAAYNNQTAGVGQLGVEGGTLNLTSVFVMNNTFKPNDGDDQAVYNSNYQFDATVSGNRVIGNFKLMQFAGLAMWDANRTNRFLQDSSKHSVLLSPVNDSASITGYALTHTTSTGPSTYPFAGIWCGGGGEKMLRIVARAAAPVTATVAVTLYLDAAYVSTVLNTANWNLTTEYTETIRRIPSSASVGNNMRPQITLPNGNTIYIQELNIYQAVGE